MFDDQISSFKILEHFVDRLALGTLVADPFGRDRGGAEG